ncbi:MAG: C40 family peptidase [Gemmatimonadales bacterium]
MHRRLLAPAFAALAAIALQGTAGGGLAAQEQAVRLPSILPLPKRPEKPFAALSRVVLSGRDSLVRAARSQVGARYRLGAMQPGRAFDCSGFVKWLAGLFDLDVPRTAREQARLGLEVPRDTARLLPGDLLFFGSGRAVTHIGVYVGDGKYVHAARPGKGVVESDLARARPSYWKGARRVFLDADSLPAALRSLVGI